MGSTEVEMYMPEMNSGRILAATVSGNRLISARYIA